MDQTVSVIDGKSNRVVNTVSVPFAFQAAVELGLSKWLYVADYAASQVHVLDITSLKDVADIPVVSSPTYIAANPTAKLVYVSNGSVLTNGSSISVIDTTTNSVVNTFSAGEGVNIYSLSADPIHNLLYAATSAPGDEQAAITILDATTGAILGTTVPLGTVTQVLALPQQHKVVPVGGKMPPPQKGPQSLIFIDGGTFSVTGIVRVGKVPVAIGFNAATRMIYTVNSFSGSVTVVGN